MIPGLKNAEFVKYGVMHKNTYINSPELLDETYNLRNNNNIFFAGQITGVEGYVESISSGMVAALNAIVKYFNSSLDVFIKEKNAKTFKNDIVLNAIKDNKQIVFSENTIIGALAKYVSTLNKNFQPMNANFGILPELEGEKIKEKKDRYMKLAQRSLNCF